MQSDLSWKMEIFPTSAGLLVLLRRMSPSSSRNDSNESGSKVSLRQTCMNPIDAPDNFVGSTTR